MSINNLDFRSRIIMNAPRARGVDLYYEKFLELQDKLRKSEEERLKLEIKFNEMLQITKEEEQAHYRRLKNQYKRFLEEDRRRQERNEAIVRALDRVEARATMLASKTERFKLLRKQYEAYMKRIYGEMPSELESSPELKKPSADNLYEHPVVKKALNKTAQMDDIKNDIIEKYLQSVASPKRQSELLKQTRQPFALTSEYLSEFSKELKNIGDNNANDYSPRSASEAADEVLYSIQSKNDQLPKRNDVEHQESVDKFADVIQEQTTKSDEDFSFNPDNINNIQQQKLIGNSIEKQDESTDRNIIQDIHTDQKLEELADESKKPVEQLNLIDHENLKQSVDRPMERFDTDQEGLKITSVDEANHLEEINDLKCLEIVPSTDGNEERQVFNEINTENQKIVDGIFTNQNEIEEGLVTHKNKENEPLQDRNTENKSTDDVEKNKVDQLNTDQIRERQDQYEQVAHEQNIQYQPRQQIVHVNQPYDNQLIQHYSSPRGDVVYQEYVDDRPLELIQHYDDQYVVSDQLIQPQYEPDIQLVVRQSPQRYEIDDQVIQQYDTGDQLIHQQSPHYEGDGQVIMIQSPQRYDVEPIIVHQSPQYIVHDQEPVIVHQSPQYVVHDQEPVIVHQSPQYVVHDQEPVIVRQSPQYVVHDQLIQQEGSQQYVDENGQLIHGDVVYEEYDQGPQQYDEGQYLYTDNGQIVEQYDVNDPAYQQYVQGGDGQYYDDQNQYLQYDENGQPLQIVDGYDENGQPIQYYASDVQPQVISTEGNVGKDSNVVESCNESDLLSQYHDQPRIDDIQQAISTEENVGKESVVEEISEVPKVTAKDEEEEEKEINNTVIEDKDVSANVTKENVKEMADQQPKGVMNMLDTDTESSMQDTKVSNDSDFDVSKS